MKRIRWSAAAAADLESICEYLQQHYPSSSQSTVRKLYQAARSLKQMPESGRRGQKPETSELIVNPLPYLIVYAVEMDAVHILRILHAARERP